MPQGERGRIGIKKEKIWSTRDGEGNSDIFLPFVSESLTTNIEELMSAAQRGILDEPKSYQGERSFGGDVVVEAHPWSIGYLLRGALGVPAAEEAAKTTETELENCEAKWVGHANIISTVDSSDYKKGSASVKLLVPDGVTGDTILATKVVHETGIDMSSDTDLKFWIKSSIDMVAEDLVAMLDETEGCVGANTKEVNVGALTAGEWKEVTLDLGDMSGENYNAIISLGIKLHNVKAEFTLRIDDVRRVVEGVASSIAFQHVFTPMQTADDEFHVDCPLFPYTLEVFPDQGKAFRFVGAVINTLALNFSTTDKILKATCGIIAKNASLQSTIGNLALEATKPFVWENAVISIGGSQNNNLESFGLTWDNHCVAKYLLNNAPTPAKIVRDGFRTIPVSFVIDFVNKDEYAYFLTGEERAFQIKFIGAVCDATPEPDIFYTLQIDLPLVRYLAYPINMGGPGRLTCAVTGKAKYDSTYALLATLINKRRTADYQRDV